MTPSVSICIPAYNSAGFIGETLRSILAQSFRDLEVIVVDDQSTDGTADVVASFDDPRVRLVRNERNLGPVANWTKALAMANGAFLKLVCGDDVLHPDCLERQVEAMQAHPDVVLVAGKRDIIDETGNVLLAARGLGGLRGRVGGPAAVRAAVLSGTNPFGEPACVLLRGDVSRSVGGFADHVSYMIDVEYWLRMLQRGSLYALDETVASFRIVQTSWSNQIAWRQSTQAIRLFREYGRLGQVSAIDVAVGAGKAVALNLIRMGVYAWLRAKGRRGRREQTRTTDEGYTERLVGLQEARWKRLLNVQAPYRWNLRRLQPGFVLDIGCGLGRNLTHVDGHGVGVDHNESSVAVARDKGLEVFTPEGFAASPFAAQGRFDSLLLSHLLEHMAESEATELVKQHAQFVRPGGKVIVITPQERGHASDPTHVEFMDFERVESVLLAAGLSVERQYSFPFPRVLGRLFVYNEFVTVGSVP